MSASGRGNHATSRAAKAIVKLARSPSVLYGYGIAISLLGLAGIGGAIAWGEVPGGDSLTFPLIAAFFAILGLLIILMGISWGNHKMSKVMHNRVELASSPPTQKSRNDGSTEVQGGVPLDMRILRSELSEQFAGLYLELEKLEWRVLNSANGQEPAALAESNEKLTVPRRVGQRGSGLSDREEVESGGSADGKAENGDSELTDQVSAQVEQVAAQLEQMSAQVEQVSSKLEEFRRSSEERHADNIKQVRKHVEDLRSRIREERRQVECWTSVQNYLSARSLLPEPGGFSIEPDLAAYLVRLIIETKPRVILELGSGLSTIILSLALPKDSDSKVVSLEHDARFKEKTERLISEFGVEGLASVRLCKLTDVAAGGGSYSWYDVGEIQSLEPIDLLLVDGPPGFGTGMARYPAIPMLLPHMRLGATIVVDDYKREDEREAVSRWLREWPVELVDERKHLHGTATLRVKDLTG